MQLTEVTTQVKFEFNELPVFIGRDSSADIDLDDPTLPPLQCMIGKSASGGVGLWNLRDEFPLYINGSPVMKAELSPGDMLNIGQSRFVFSCEVVDTGFKYLGAGHHRRAILPAAC